jgi:diadenylate cyclase
MFEFDKIVRWQDVLDIVLVAILFYQLINIIRGTRSVQMVLGLIVLVGVYFLASILDLATLLWLLQTFLGSLFLIIIIVFQDDIRRALTQVGKSPFQRSVSIIEKDLDEITRAAYYLAKRRNWCAHRYRA